ncbi:MULTISPECIES: hypothetical protein [Streptomyces]|uniref:hypothetical protein n=1 Tax=Streptomyces TaxID=1883 RepID=UPI0036B1359C
MANDPNPNPTGPDDPTGEGDQGGQPATGNERQDDAAKTGEGDQGDPSAELSAERTARAAAEKRAETAEAEAARLRRSNAAQKPGDLDALRAEIRTEFAGQLVRAELRAAAAGKLRDPADALALVDVAALVGEGGDPDPAAIAAAVDQLVTDKPYLSAESAPAGPVPWGDVGAGQRGTSGPADDEPVTAYERLRRVQRN